MGANGGLRFACIGLILIAFLGFPAKVCGEIRLGPFRITPYVTGKGTYTDNVFLTQRSEKSDFYYSILPGVNVRIRPIGRHYFYLDYEADISTYDKYTEANTFTHSADAGLDLNLPRGFGVKVGNKITQGADPPDFEGDKDAKYIKNVSRIAVSKNFFDRFGIDVRYSHEFKDYDRSRDEVDNFNTNTVGGTFRFRILRRTSALVDYVYSITDYRKRRRANVENNYSNRLNTGIMWDITEKTRGSVKGGYIRTDYYRVDRDDDALFASANISHELTSHITVALEGIRSIFDTSNADDNIQFGTSYVSSQVRTKLRHTYRKFTTNLRGEYIHDKYLHDDSNFGRKRKDDVWRGSVGVDYGMQRWLKFGVKYRYTDLDSNFDSEDYRENLVAFHVGLSL
jgi:hypothetical protein